MAISPGEGGGPAKIDYFGSRHLTYVRMKRERKNQREKREILAVLKKQQKTD